MQQKNNLRVWYGYAKLTKKTIKKHQLVIFFENSNYNKEKNLKWINQKIHIIYTRFQNEGEASDAQHSNRMFTKYGYFIDEKPFFGNIEKVLNQNFLADLNNVSEEERTKIKDLLRKAYYNVYKIPKIKENNYNKKTGQISFIF